MSFSAWFSLLASINLGAGFCPSYSASSRSNSKNCGVEAQPGTNPTLAEWQAIFDKVSQGPSQWEGMGPPVDEIGQGCGAPEPLKSVTARFPCELLKAIAMKESGWRQFCEPTEPSDQLGKGSRTLISFDCGYGIGQVTSGMRSGDSTSFNRLKVAADPFYNLAAGASILASKWRAAECVGDNQPSIIEHWYSAIWAYNGRSYVNNPNNPIYSSSRGAWNPSTARAAPYQERIFGYLEHAPEGRWKSVAVAYPKLSDVAGDGAPGPMPEPRCATPSSCADTRPVHSSTCLSADVSSGAPAPLGDGDGSAAGCSSAGSDLGAALALCGLVVAWVGRRRPNLSRGFRSTAGRP